VKI
ncbi:hypothetical protein CP8484711_1031B, partial [Chlamydia psittaci 84-8471/1]|jgi:hypothetical protein